MRGELKPKDLGDCLGMIEDGTGIVARLSLVSVYLDGVSQSAENDELCSMAAFTASNIVWQCIGELNDMAEYMRGVEHGTADDGRPKHDTGRNGGTQCGTGSVADDNHNSVGVVGITDTLRGTPGLAVVGALSGVEPL